jgi:hypothetical protein
MIRMTKGAAEGTAAVVAVCEAAKYPDGQPDSLEVAKTAMAIALAWADGAEAWEGWTFVRGGEL